MNSSSLTQQLAELNLSSSSQRENCFADSEKDLLLKEVSHLKDSLLFALKKNLSGKDLVQYVQT